MEPNGGEWPAKNKEERRYYFSSENQCVYYRLHQPSNSESLLKKHGGTYSIASKVNQGVPSLVRLFDNRLSTPRANNTPSIDNNESTFLLHPQQQHLRKDGKVGRGRWYTSPPTRAKFDLDSDLVFYHLVDYSIDYEPPANEIAIKDRLGKTERLDHLQLRFEHDCTFVSMMTNDPNYTDYFVRGMNVGAENMEEKDDEKNWFIESGLKNRVLFGLHQMLRAYACVPHLPRSVEMREKQSIVDGGVADVG